MPYYNREAATSYAQKWAFSRNPNYYNFDPIRWGLYKFCVTMYLCWM